MSEATIIALFGAAAAFSVQLLFIVYGYGKLQEKVTNIIVRLERIERQENAVGRKYTMGA